MSIINTSSTNNEEQMPLLKVVEYLESSMSTNLLSKFPDNSAFDFDYTQSSIWSPLLPPPPASDDSLSGRGGLELSRKLSYDEGDDKTTSFIENTKKVAATIKRKFTDAVFDNVSSCYMMQRKNKRKRTSFGISPLPGSSRRLSSSTTSPKAWAKVMKAASKHFKKTKKSNKKKKEYPNVHLDRYYY